MKITGTIGVMGSTVEKLEQEINKELRIATEGGYAVVDIRYQACVVSGGDGVADWYTALLLIGEAS